jgi:phenylpyruvate tautomerase PptA (4-oxalocrotonate tautomerase family)
LSSCSEWHELECADSRAVVEKVELRGQRFRVVCAGCLRLIIAAAAADPSLAWVLVSEASDGGWGIDGHAYSNVEIAETARRQITETWFPV